MRVVRLFSIVLIAVLSISSYASSSPRVELETSGACYVGTDLYDGVDSWEDYDYHLKSALNKDFVDYKSGGLSCETANDFALVLDSMSGLMGTVMALCGTAPEPIFSKSAMVVIALGVGGLRTASLILRKAPCENRSEEILLEGEDALAVKKQACAYVDGKFDEQTSTCYGINKGF